MTATRIVLASTSRYRATLLGRLLDAFEQAAPGVDEAALAHESPRARAARLAQAKARAVAASHPDALVIGSDQVAERDGVILDKPGDPATAQAQLEASSGSAVRFHTAVCVIDTRCTPHEQQQACDLTRVRFRSLDAATIQRYIAREQPFDCAGSFKCEALGISLFDRIESTDPTALVGLPLIALSGMLRACGMPIP